MKYLILNQIINSNLTKFNIYNFAAEPPKNKRNFNTMNSCLTQTFHNSEFSIKIINNSKFSNIKNNPKLKKLHFLLEEGCTKTNIKELKNYINNIIRLTPDDLFNKYISLNNTITPIWTNPLPEGFNKLIEYKDKAGIYYYQTREGKGYVGATYDLRRRNSYQHKNNFNIKGRHFKFYDYVKKNT